LGFSVGVVIAPVDAPIARVISVLRSHSLLACIPPPGSHSETYGNAGLQLDTHLDPRHVPQWLLNQSLTRGTYIKDGGTQKPHNRTSVRSSIVRPWAQLGLVIKKYSFANEGQGVQRAKVRLPRSRGFFSRQGFCVFACDKQTLGIYRRSPVLTFAVAMRSASIRRTGERPHRGSEAEVHEIRRQIYWGCRGGRPHEH